MDTEMDRYEVPFMQETYEKNCRNMDINFHEGWPVGDGEGRNKYKHLWHMETRSKMKNNCIFSP
jgi:hypothetical protein